MPTYDYQCTKCGHQFEAFQKMSEAPLTTCPHCEATSLTKLISPVGFQLKGGGWYATGYSNESKPKETPENKPAESKTDAKAETVTKKDTTGSE